MFTCSTNLTLKIIYAILSANSFFFGKDKEHNKFTMHKFRKIIIKIIVFIISTGTANMQKNFFESSKYQ